MNEGNSKKNKKKRLHSLSVKSNNKSDEQNHDANCIASFNNPQYRMPVNKEPVGRIPNMR